MSAACPDIPIVVLPANNLVRAETTPGPEITAALAGTIGALLGLRTELMNPRGAGAAVDGALDAAVERAHRLAALACAGLPPLDTASLVPIVPNHEYFGVRTAPLEDERLLAEVSTIIARALADLRHARVSLYERAAIALAMTRILGGLTADPSGPAADDADADETTSAGTGAEPAAGPASGPYMPEAGELTRWIVTHHFYFVLNLAAADTVSRGLAALRDDDRDTALALIREATVYVRGFTAAMMHSGDMSAPCYDAEVRPTMCPPAVPAALTGRTQPEHKAFRRAMKNLVKEWGEPFGKLAAADLELAAARDALLEADMQDIERHIVVTAALVGDDSSIVAGDESAESAVAVLRMMRHMRAVTYRDLMRFGDKIEVLGE
jgi:hypothetical protein